MSEVAVLPKRVEWARRVARDHVERFGWLQTMEVAEELGLIESRLVVFEFEQMRLSLTDIQLVAFASALKANGEAL